MRAFLLAIGLIASTAASAADPADTEPGTTMKRDLHPAIAARRVQAPQGYDYASKFYPHPAWLYLSAEAPHPMSHHPGVIAWQRAQDEQRLAQEAAGRVVAEH